MSPEAAGGRPSESLRGAQWARLAEARRRARGDRRTRTGNGPQGPRGHRSPVWAAVAPGYQPARDLRHWLAAVTDAAYVAYRSDAAERRIELAWILAKHTDWRTCTSRCGWALLADRGCVSRRTVARFYAWLRAENLVGVVSTGRSAITRPMALTGPPSPAVGVSPGSPRPVSDNEAAVYVLTEPVPDPRAEQPPDPGLVGLDPRYWTGELQVGIDGRVIVPARRHFLTVDELGTPNGSPLVTSQHTPARACTSCHRIFVTPLRGRNIGTSSLLIGKQKLPTWHPDTQSDRGLVDAGNVPVLCSQCQATRWPRHLAARTKRDRLALCDRLRHDAPALTWVGSTRRLRWLLADFLSTGWTAGDVLHAIDHHPDTGIYPYATAAPGQPGGLRNPAGWLIHRLRPWRTPDGTPVPPFSRRHVPSAAGRAAPQTTAGAAGGSTGPVSGPSAAYLAARDSLRRRTPHAVALTARAAASWEPLTARVEPEG